MKRIFTKYHHSYLIDEETEVLRGEMTCLVLLSQEEGDLGLELRFLLGIL